MIRQKQKGQIDIKLNNRGSAIVSVVIITLFVTVLATTLLYVSGQNFKQKQTDYQNKQSFYKAEEALDCLKALLVSYVSEAFEEAYEDTVSNFVLLGTSEARKSNYQDKFIAKLEELIGSSYEPETCLEIIYNMMSADYPELASYIYSVDSMGGDISSGEKIFSIKGIRAKYTLGNYTTFLYTDISIIIPDEGMAIPSNTTTSTVDTKTVPFTDYVVYVNWRRDDYDE